MTGRRGQPGAALLLVLLACAAPPPVVAQQVSPLQGQGSAPEDGVPPIYVSAALDRMIGIDDVNYRFGAVRGKEGLESCELACAAVLPCLFERTTESAWPSAPTSTCAAECVLYLYLSWEDERGYPANVEATIAANQTGTCQVGRLRRRITGLHMSAA